MPVDAKSPARPAAGVGTVPATVALALVPVLLGATWAHAGNGWVFNAPNGGWEYPAFWTVTLIVQALLGDGMYAVRPSGRAAEWQAA